MVQCQGNNSNLLQQKFFFNQMMNCYILVEGLHQQACPSAMPSQICHCQYQGSEIRMK